MSTVRPLSTRGLQPTEYRHRRETRAWLPFPSRYFYLDPKDIWTATGVRTKFLSLHGRWPGSRLQVFALSWPDGTTWDLATGWRSPSE